MKKLTAILCLTITFCFVQLEPVMAVGMFKCSEPLPEFTLGQNSNPTSQQIKQLCSCIWGKFPVNGWERRTSAKIRAGKDPGWRGKGLIPRFGKALKECGGYKL